jgi:hypothetical protein
MCDKKDHEEEKKMAVPSEKIKSGLTELRERAMKRKNDPNLRHIMNTKEKEIYNQNAQDMQKAQFRTMK